MEIQTASPRASAEHRHLEIFEGKWQTEGQILATNDKPATKVSGTDIYKWLPGGFFLVHHIDVKMGEENMSGIEIIGYNEAQQSYYAHAFDSQGNYSTYDLYRRDDGSWSIQSQFQRATIIPDRDYNTLNAEWEKSEDGLNWEPWMKICLKKTS